MLVFMDAWLFDGQVCTAHRGFCGCNGCGEAWEAQQESEMYAEFGMSWVHGGGDRQDVAAAWNYHRKLLERVG